MKIAILSMQEVLNYGSVLQAYSLKKMIEKITGNDVDFINIERKKKVAVDMPVRDSIDYQGENVSYKDNVFYMIHKCVNHVKKKKADVFLAEFQKESLKLNADNNKKQYDLVVVGSDEVFKAQNSICLQLYGEISNAKDIITYAASCGSASISGIPMESKKEIVAALNNITSMSVRDRHTYEYISKLYDKEIVFNLDPVLVGELSLREHKNVLLRNYMIVYAYGDRIKAKEEIEVIKKFARKRKLKLVALGAPQFWCDEFIPTTPFELLDYFYHADYIVTDTFHGSIFSIINKKKFVTFIRKSNENKLSDLLERLNLNERIVKNCEMFEEKITNNIDYFSVECILEQERKKTLNYLRENIILKNV